MKVYPHKIEVESKLVLSGRELELLNNLLSYDYKPWVKSVTPNSYAGGVTEKELLAFVESLKGAAAEALASVNETVKNGLLRD